MPTHRKTAIVQFELPGNSPSESLPLTTEREFNILLTIEGQTTPAEKFRAPINDEQWRDMTNRMRDCNRNRNDDGYRGAVFLRTIGRSLYQNLCGLSPALADFLQQDGTPRRLVLQSTRPELHLLPWGAMSDSTGRFLAGADLSVVESWEDYRETPLSFGGTVNLVAQLDLNTGRVTAKSIDAANLPPEIRQDANSPADILHVEMHGDAVTNQIGAEGAMTLARTFAGAGPEGQPSAPKMALLWSCYSASANSWGDSPALCLHQLGVGLVVSFQAELHNLDAASISWALYQDVFGPAASRDPETALVRIRAARFRDEFDYANWASMKLYLRAPLDMSALPLNGARVPATGWSETPADDPSWDEVNTAVARLQSGSWIGLPSLPAADCARLPLALVARWRGNVIRLDGPEDPLSDAVLRELNLPLKDAPRTDVADKLVWFFTRIAHYGAPLIVWTNALPHHMEFLKAIEPPPTLTFLLLFSDSSAPFSVSRLVDLNEIEAAQQASSNLAPGCGDEELSAAYYAFVRSEDSEQARAILARLQSPSERALLSGNFVSRWGRTPDLPPASVNGLERWHTLENYYAKALAEAAGDDSPLRQTGRARHELGYMFQAQERRTLAETFYRAALDDLERCSAHDSRWHLALGAVLRDFADLLGRCADRLDEARILLARALAIHSFHGRSLQVAHALTTRARIAQTACRPGEAVEVALDAANRFEACSNWRGWSDAIKILFETLASNGEASRMLQLIQIATEKLQISNLDKTKRADVERMLNFQRANAHWIAGDLAEAATALKLVMNGAPDDFERSPAGAQATRLSRFLSLSPSTDWLPKP